MLKTAAVTLALLIPVAASAQDFRSSNNLTVRPLSATDFEVLGQASSNAKSYWCAASQYVQRRMGNPARARITVVTPTGSSQTGPRNVTFSIAPDAGKSAKVASYSVSVQTAGTQLSVGLAAEFCDDLIRQDKGF